MANITVSTTSNLDDSANLALNNGETITITSGATLTINSDNRWSQQAAVVGVTTISDGALLVDGTQVWWVPFDASSGNVPSLGTNGVADVTVGGVNRGEFLGIFTALGVAPSTAGTAMPSTGFVKLRRAIGTIADNDVLTFSNGATVTVNSASGGQRGWLSIVGRQQSTGVAVSGFSSTTWTGDWFELGTTNGQAGQQVQYYVSDLCPALQIETAAGSGVFEWWQHIPTTQAPAGSITTTAGSAIVTGTGTSFSTSLTPIGSPLFSGDTLVGFVLSIQSTTQLTLTSSALSVVTNASSLRSASNGTGINTTNFGTDVRNNVYTSNPSSGIITFCGANAGRLPPNGARIRVPNIHVSIAPTSNYATNVVVSFPEWSFVISNSLNSTTKISYVNGQHRFASSAGKLLDVRFSGHIDGNAGNGSNFPTSFEEVYFQDCVTCQHASYGASYAAHFYVNRCKKVTFKNCYMWAMFDSLAFSVQNSANVTLDGGFWNRLQSNSFTGNITGCTNVYVQDTKFGNIGNNFYNWIIDGCTGVYLKNWTYVGRVSSSQFLSAVQIGVTNCTDVVWDGYQYWIDPPANRCFWSNSADVRIRNIGTMSSPFVVGSDFQLSGFSTVVKRLSLNNIFVTGTNINPVNFVNLEGLLATSCAVTSGSGQFPTRITVPGYSRRNPTNAVLTVGGVGGHFGESIDSLTSPTTIRMVLACGSPKDDSDYRSTIAFTEDVGTFRRDGASVAMVALNDQITWTWSYYVKGVTSFANTAPTINGTNVSNHTITYDIDKGVGFTGTFKALTAANLSAESGISIAGVRLRIRAVCNTASITNRLNSIYVFANTNATSVANAFYPNNEAKYSIVGVLDSSRAAMFRNSDGAMLYQASKSSPINLFCDWYQDTSATLRVRKPGYRSEEYALTLRELGESIAVSQVDNIILDANPGSKAITVTNHGASPVSWNGKQWSITITVSDGSSAATVAQWVSWNQSQDAYTFDGVRHNMAYHDMVIASGALLETARGTVFGSTGAALKGVRVVDASGNEISGFARMQADDGTYYSPAASYALTVVNIAAGSRILVRRTDTSAIIANQIVSTGSFVYTYTYTSSIPIEIVVRKATESPFLQEWRTTTTLEASNNTQTANQLSDS